MNIHLNAASGDMASLMASLAAGVSIEARDHLGHTPLMVAATSPMADADMLRMLLDQGADVNAVSLPEPTVKLDAATRASLEQAGIDTSIYDNPHHASHVDSVLGCAVRSATCDKIMVLLEAGADVGYVNPGGYSILINAMYRENMGSADHQAMIGTLIDAGAPLDLVSNYGESALGVASHRGEFGLVTMLLKRGANPKPLRWTPLFDAIAAGNLQTVAKLIDEGASLERRDAWDRTPFLLSVHAGHLQIAKLLLDRGCDGSARGRCGQTALMYAISRDDAATLKWLIAMGRDVEEADEFGNFPLRVASQEGAVRCVESLLEAGASPGRRSEYESGAIHDATVPEIVRLLVAAGEDLGDVGSEVRRQLVRSDLDTQADLPEHHYRRNKRRVFGTRNPERMNNALWDMMVRSRISAYTCASKHGDSGCDREAVWCFQRFGHSMTQLPDGRYVEIGGEHEDHYDVDFCIYNDVVVHRGDSTFDLFGYPEDLFPPTDFHSATLAGSHIYIVGCLGYPQQRRPGTTPVYRLDCETWAIEPVECTGDAPGWIHKHKARLVGSQLLEIRGGLIADGPSGNMVENARSFVLDLAASSWRRGTSDPA